MSDPTPLSAGEPGGGDKHGDAIMEDIQRFAGVPRGPAGTLYGAITRLEQRGWIRAALPDDGSYGRAKA